MVASRPRKRSPRRGMPGKKEVCGVREDWETARRDAGPRELLAGNSEGEPEDRCTGVVELSRQTAEMMKNEVTREPKAKEVDERSMQDLRRKHSWWPGDQGKGELTAPTRGFGAEAEDIMN